MPLYGKVPFIRKAPPAGIHPDERVFCCKLTCEVFTDYEEYFARVILCNSLVWTCSVTGKSGLTFQDALQSEERAIATLEQFPEGLRRPLLLLSTRTCRKRPADAAEDVFGFARDRYFVGERVEVTVKSHKKTCTVTAVTPLRAPPRSGSPQKKQQQHLPADGVKYEVVDADGKAHFAGSSEICRKKNSYTREKNRIFFRQALEPKDDVMVVKESVRKKYALDEARFSDFFAGPPPAFSASPKKASAPVEKVKKPKTSPAKETQKKKEGGTPTKKEAAEKAAEAEAKQRERELADLFQRKMAEKEARKMKVQQKLEEKRLYAQFLSEWNRPREDLECDDLKELPPLVPLKCGVPPDRFGDLVMVLDFLNLFSKQLDLKDYFSSGVTYELLEQALTEVDVLGHLGDVFQLLLAALLRIQEEEMQAERKNPGEEESEDEDGDGILVGGISMKRAQKAATAVARRPQQVLGVKLTKVTLDALSLSEVLRLHLGGSGSPNVARKVFGGWYAQREDPGLWFVAQEPQIMAKLGEGSVYELAVEEKIKLMKVLVDQLLSTEAFRGVVEENLMKLKQLKHDLRQLRLAFFREDKETKVKRGKEGSPDSKKEGEAEDKSPEEAEVAALPVELSKELLQKKERDDVRRKEELERKEQVLRKQIERLQRFCCQQPVGQDRAHRRYWTFSSLPGLFVEDSDAHKGACLPGGTPLVRRELPKNPSVAFMETFLLDRRGEVRGGDVAALSDKENKETVVERKPPGDAKAQKLLGDSNPRVARRTSVEVPGRAETKPVSDKPDAHPPWTCSGCAETCTVHGGTSRKARWWFCRDKGQLEALMAALNQRGFRESKLRAALRRDPTHYESLVTRCPGKRLNPEADWPEESDGGEQEVRKSARLLAGASKPSNLAGMEPKLAEALSLREALLELEEKVFAGSLGEVEDREKWRSNLDGLLAVVEAKKGNVAEMERVARELDRSAEMATLSRALLDVASGVERKFLQAPLGETEEQRKKRKGGEQAEEKKGREVLENWQEAVRKSTSISQLSLCLSALERSIAWDRSLLKACCRICKRRRDPEKMLLCDGCDRGHHVYCLRPPLDEIPKGDWYCTACRPKEKSPSPVKRKYVEEDEEEDADEEEDGNEDACDVCDKGGTLICCDACPLAFHMECIDPPLRRVPRGAWTCHKCTKAKAAAIVIRGKGSRTRSQSAAADSKRYIEQQKRALAGSKKRHGTASAPEGVKRPRTDGDSTNGDDAATSRASSRRSSQDLPLDFKACDEILQALVHDNNSWPFHCAVSRRSVPDYYDIIKRPMDLGKIRGKLSGMEYRTTKEFVADVYLIFQNCSVYNSAGSAEYAAGAGLLAAFERLLTEHGLRGYPHSDCFERDKRARRTTARK